MATRRARFGGDTGSVGSQVCVSPWQVLPASVVEYLLRLASQVSPLPLPTSLVALPWPCYNSPGRGW